MRIKSLDQVEGMKPQLLNQGDRLKFNRED